ncbi:DUF4326 domain-containing protein [Alicyclobacillus sendaiensis]|uniref:DUF4326 domain-containing protein n=1 Tax=Alicyclobacillus sendaiensis TaxID=192387 RepID=UPI003D250290
MAGAYSRACYRSSVVQDMEIDFKGIRWIEMKDTSRVVHCRREPYDVYIGRAVPRFGLRQSKWANPFRIGKDGTREECIAKYREYLLSRPELLEDLEELRGKTLGCWCKPAPCHGDVLVELLEERR